MTTAASRTAEVDRIAEALGTRSQSRILSALGHPGYGASFAAAVLKAWTAEANEVRDLHDLVYGLSEYVGVDSSN